MLLCEYINAKMRWHITKFESVTCMTLQDLVTPTRTFKLVADQSNVAERWVGCLVCFTCYVRLDCCLRTFQLVACGTENEQLYDQL